MLECPGELSVHSAHGIPGPVTDARLCLLPEQGLEQVAAVTEDALCPFGEEGVIKAALWVFNWHLSWLSSSTGWRGLLGCCVLGS